MVQKLEGTTAAENSPRRKSRGGWGAAVRCFNGTFLEADIEIRPRGLCATMPSGGVIVGFETMQNRTTQKADGLREPLLSLSRH